MMYKAKVVIVLTPYSYRFPERSYPMDLILVPVDIRYLLFYDLVEIGILSFKILYFIFRSVTLSAVQVK